MPEGLALRGRVAPDAVPAALYAAAGLSLVAALVHLLLLPGQLAGSPARGGLVAAFALAQGLYGLALMRWPSEGTLLAGLAGNVAVVSFYAAGSTETSFGPHGWQASGAEVLEILLAAAGAGLALALLLRSAHAALHAAEALSFGAALAYVWEASDRYGEWWGFWAFPLAVGLAQGLYGVGLSHLGGRASYLLAGVAFNLSVVAAWAATRAVGIPYARTTAVESPELRIGRAEGVGVADLAATTLEVALVAVLVALAVSLHRAEAPRKPLRGEAPGGGARRVGLTGLVPPDLERNER